MEKLDFNFRRTVTRLTIFSGVLLLLFIGLAFTQSEKESESTPTTSLLEVEISAPVFEKITEWDEYTGRFEASNRVEVRARVSGFIDRVNFVDGQIVKKGDVLFTLDSRPFKIALNQANADLEQAQVSLKTAQENFERVGSLKESGAVSTEEFDRRKQALEYAKASVQLSQAKVEEAKLNLEFTKVTAPISGLVSRDKVNLGNLIDGGSSNSTLLTTIVATSPIHFYFTGSESDFLKYVRQARNGERSSARSEGIPVFIKLQDETEYAHEAIIDFVDNELDVTTGTIESRAVLDNKDLLLEPGMFGKAKLMGSDEHEALMIPDEIIGTNQSLRFVYVLGKDNQVEMKNITLGPLHSNGLRIVRSGINPNDKLILNNIQKVVPGMSVSPKTVSLKPENGE